MDIIALIFSVIALFLSAFNFLISIGVISLVKPKVDKYKDYRDANTKLLKSRPTT